MICKGCHKVIDGDARFCPNCGADASRPQPDEVDDDRTSLGDVEAAAARLACPQCATSQRAGYSYCSSCNRELAPVDDATTMAEPVESTPQPLVLDPLIGQRLWGRFDVQARIGKGGMGEVYRCKDLELRGREVAVKVLLPHLVKNELARERHVTEVLAATGLRHTNIVSVFDIHHDEIHFGFSMELLEGHTLEEHLQGLVPGSPLGGVATAARLPLVLAIARQLADALEYIHAPNKGLVHRDVKPSNVMLCGELTPDSVKVKLLDFGVVLAPDGPDESGLQQPGTHSYMAPELRDGTSLPSPSTDVFSFGFVVYRALTDSAPAAALEPPSTRVAGLPAYVDDAVLSCLSDAEHRPATIAEVTRTLRLVSVTEIPAPPVPRGGRFASAGCLTGVLACATVAVLSAMNAILGFLGTAAVAVIQAAVISMFMYRRLPTWGLLYGTALWCFSFAGALVFFRTIPVGELGYYAVAAIVTGVGTGLSMLVTRGLVDLGGGLLRRRRRP